ncbi:MAG: ribosome silencing factor [Verrucomicrobiota bacterium]
MCRPRTSVGGLGRAGASAVLCLPPWNAIFWGKACTRSKGAWTIEPLALAKKVKKALLSKKGEDVVILDVRGLSSITDYYVIATGNNPPHIKALASEVERALAAEGARRYRQNGTAESQWIVVDYLDAVVHVFSPQTRSYYALDRLWGDAKKVG